MQRTAITVVGLMLAGVGGHLYSQEAGALQKLSDSFEIGVAVIEPPRSQATGRGVIRGSVTTAGTGAPVRGATVRGLFGSGDAAPAIAVTDDSGAFELRGLAAGSWQVSASKTGFLPREFGQRGSTGRGSFIAVRDQDVVTANILLLRGGAVAGRVFDEFGDPAVGVRVQVAQFVQTENGQRLAPAGVADLSDDTGAFRVYGLMPGDYLVSARAPTPFDGESFVAGVAGDQMVMQRLNDKVVALAARAGGAGLHHATASTYFPGTTDISAANRVTIGAGDERHDIDFQLIRAASARITGSVISSSAGAPAATMVSLLSDSLDMNATFAMTNPIGLNGAFEFRDVPPGSYVLTVTKTGGGTVEMAEVPLRVTEDITGLEVVTAPGVSLRGTIVSDDAALPALRGVLVRATPSSGRRQAFMATAGAVVDSAFTVPNLLGTFRLAVQNVPAGWILKSITIDGVDVTDTPVTFVPGQRPTATVVLTNRITELSGVVTNNRRPIDADVLIFPDDPAKWTSQRFVRSLRANADGTFSLRGLPPHDNYLAIASDYLESGELLNPEFLEGLRSRATAFPLEEGRSRRLNLTLVERSMIDGR